MNAARGCGHPPLNKSHALITITSLPSILAHHLHTITSLTTITPSHKITSPEYHHILSMQSHLHHTITSHTVLATAPMAPYCQSPPQTKTQDIRLPCHKHHPILMHIPDRPPCSHRCKHTRTRHRCWCMSPFYGTAWGCRPVGCIRRRRRRRRQCQRERIRRRRGMCSHLARWCTYSGIGVGVTAGGLVHVWLNNRSIGGVAHTHAWVHPT